VEFNHRILLANQLPEQLQRELDHPRRSRCGDPAEAFASRVSVRLQELGAICGIEHLGANPESHGFLLECNGFLKT
jgi:hypothetical protein